MLNTAWRLTTWDPYLFFLHPFVVVLDPVPAPVSHRIAFLDTCFLLFGTLAFAALHVLTTHNGPRNLALKPRNVRI